VALERNFYVHLGVRVKEFCGSRFFIFKIPAKFWKKLSVIFAKLKTETFFFIAEAHCRTGYNIHFERTDSHEYFDWELRSP
jgi:hypothetical protein